MIKWKLKQIMVDKGLWTGQELLDLLESKAGVIISHTAVMQLIKSEPKAIRFQTLEALCTALECSPWDLIEYKPSQTKKQISANIAGDSGAIQLYPRNKKGEMKEKTLYPDEEF
jgi:putative transcriptional regulator